MKNIKILVVVLVVFISSIMVVNAGKNNDHIQNYVSDNLLWKWYGNDWTTGKLPIIEVSSDLIEGVDYVRSWSFTRDLVGDVSKLEYFPYEESITKEQLPGSVCEKITGLGDYVSEKVVCHVIYGYTYIIPDNQEKVEGENDPTFTYRIVNYNNLNDDILSFFNITIEREEGEKPGEYVLTPKFTLKDESVVALSFSNNIEIGSIQYLFKNLGRIIVEPVKAKLTINKKEETNEEIVEVINEEPDIEEYIAIPHTDICLH